MNFVFFYLDFIHCVVPMMILLRRSFIINVVSVASCLFIVGIFFIFDATNGKYYNGIY